MGEGSTEVTDWQVGDLALCVSQGPDPDDWAANCGGPRLGSVQLVAEVQWLAEDGLSPEGVHLSFEDHFDSYFYHLGFVKVTPPAADDFDREVIQQMVREPVSA